MADEFVDSVIEDVDNIDNNDNGNDIDNNVNDNGNDLNNDTENSGKNQPVEKPTSTSAIRSAVKAASEALPEQSKLFKQLADNSFREQAYKAVFPTPQEATVAKQVLESVGGIEGVTKLQERVSGYDNQDEALRSGNPEVLDALFKDFPEGVVELAPHFLEKLAELNPKEFSAAVSPYVIALLDNSGVGSHLQAMLNESDPAKLKELITNLAQWYGNQAQSVQKLISNRTEKVKNPEIEKLNAERDALRTEKEETFKEGVREKVNSIVNPAIASEVDKYAKQYKLNDTQKEHFRKTLEQTIIADLSSDENYKKQVDLKYGSKTRSKDSISSYISNEVTRVLRLKSFEVVKSIYGAPKGTTNVQKTGVAKPGTPNTTPTGGAFKISARPKNEDLDLNRPNADVLLLQGKGYLKTGKYVTWR